MINLASMPPKCQIIYSRRRRSRVGIGGAAGRRTTLLSRHVWKLNCFLVHF